MRLITQQEFRTFISPFASDQLTPAGYDLRAAKCQSLTTGEEVDLSERGAKYRITHGDFVIITTKEIVDLSTRDDIFGQVYSKVSFAIRGLSHLGTKIDPGFKGPLRLSFENRAFDLIEITGKITVCNVVLLQIEHTNATYTPQPPETLLLRPEQPPITFGAPRSPELRRWYSPEVLDVGEQLWACLKEFQGSLEKRMGAQLEQTQEAVHRSEIIFSTAVVTIFLSASAIIATVIAAGALIFQELAKETYNSTVMIWAAAVSGIVFLTVMFTLVWLLLRHQRGRKGAP